MVIMDIIKCEAALFNKDQQVDCGIVLRRNFQHFGPEIGMTEFTSHHVLLCWLLLLLFSSTLTLKKSDVEKKLQSHPFVDQVVFRILISILVRHHLILESGAFS